MKNTYLIIGPVLLVLLLVGCEKETTVAPSCTTEVVVVDRSQLDGCGMQLKTNEGKYLVPIQGMLICGTPPLPPEFDNFIHLIEGKKYKINFDYVEKEYYDICMAGKPIKVTCVTELNSTLENF